MKGIWALELPGDTIVVEYPVMVSNKSRERQTQGRQNGIIDRTSVLNDDSMAVCGFLGIFMARKVLGSLSEASFDSTRPTKMIAEQENDFWKDCEKHSPIKLLKDTFE